MNPRRIPRRIYRGRLRQRVFSSVRTPTTHRHSLDDLLERLRSIFADSYDVDEELTGGGMSRLFIATERALNRRVVIKILPPELTSEVMAARFKRESEVTARLQHPHILPIITAGLRDGLLFYVMPYIAGESLRVRLKREPQLPVSEAVGILREVSSALGYAHKQGVIHRDIKPENILLQENHAVLADFGIAAAIAGTAHSAGEKLTRTGMSIGTIGYMAPEQSLGGPEVDSRADIYSLGVVAHEMLAGEPPFTGSTTQAILAAHLTQSPTRLDDLRDDVPVGTARAIEKALQKDPDARYQTAEAFRDALETAPQRMSTISRLVSPRKLRRNWRKIGGVAVAAAALAFAGVWVLQHRRAGGAEEAPITILIAPFVTTVSDTSELKLWGEGIVDVLSRDLDGAGPLRTISPAVAIRKWKGTGTESEDRKAALSLARETGAEYVVYGSLGGSGVEAVRIRATLLDSRADKVVNSYEPTDVDVDKAAGKLTLAILGDLNTRHRIGAVRHASLGSTSLPALRAFLKGEQYFRKTSWDSASAAYAKAVSLDTSFALALRRSGQVLVWERSGRDSLAGAYALSAGRRNHGLAPRDSLLITADSLTAALSAGTLDSRNWKDVRRLFATVAEAVRRYPGDPEAWYSLGEARYHQGYGSELDITERDVLAAFERSIQIDSAFAPAYIHAVELGFTLEGAAGGRRFAVPYLARRPTDKNADGIRVAELVADPERSRSAASQKLLESLPTEVLISAWLRLKRWPDSSETALSLLRHVTSRPRSSPTYVADSLRLRSYLPLQLAYSGRLREAHLALGNRPTRLLPELALFGGVEPDTAARVFTGWIATRQPQVHFVLPWWTARGDTNSIRALIAAYADDSAKAASADRRRKTYDVTAARAYLLLARRDSAGALRLFQALSDTSCLTCYLDRLTAAGLLRSKGRYAEADKLLRQRLDALLTPSEVRIGLERARVLENLANTGSTTGAARAEAKQAAARLYAEVVNAWSRGDPELQQMVRESRQALGRLASR